MNPELDNLDLEFALQGAPSVRVTTEGFVIGTAAPASALRGTVQAWSLVRKYFRDRKLVCWSTDGIRGQAGKRCESCSDRGRCSPRIRLAIGPAAETLGGARDVAAHGGSLLTLELSYSSCRNFLDYARRIRATDGQLSRVPTRLTILPRGHWGEVCFEVDADLFHASDPLPGPDPSAPA